jgi:hypothetical protein
VKYNERLAGVMQRAGVRFVNLLDPLQRAYKVHGESMFVPWDGHNADIANGVIAAEIARVVSTLPHDRAAAITRKTDR